MSGGGRGPFQAGVEAFQDRVVEAIPREPIETSMPTLRQRRVNTSDIYIALV
jgi:hypothetical protein